MQRYNVLVETNVTKADYDVYLCTDADNKIADLEKDIRTGSGLSRAKIAQLEKELKTQTQLVDSINKSKGAIVHQNNELTLALMEALKAGKALLVWKDGTVGYIDAEKIITARYDSACEVLGLTR